MIIAAAGRGERLGARENKAFVPLSGQPLVWYALEVARACPEVTQIILAVAPEDVERARALLRPSPTRSELVVSGGVARQDSVAAALAEVNSECDLVAVHDAARPFVTPGLLQQCLAEAAREGAAVAAVRSTDTVKQAGPDRLVAATLDRTTIWLVQTPQVFRRRLLQRAYETAVKEGVTGTDDAMLVERLGHAIRLVESDRSNIKITWPEDVWQSEQVLRSSKGMKQMRMNSRTGIGYDAHRFTEDRPLVLGGVRIRDQRGLLGHSDADVLCHAITDALLGAIAAGDIGAHFPDTDPRYAGADSLALLAEAAALLRQAGWVVANVDAVVIAEEPRLAPYLPAITRALAQAIGIDTTYISVKGKTTEGMGFTGRGEGIAAQAVAAVQRIPRARTRAQS